MKRPDRYRYIFGAILALMLVAVAGAYFLVQSAWFQERARTLVVERLSESVGMEIKMERFRAGLGVARLRLCPARLFLELLDHFQGVAGVVGIVDQSPTREAQGPAPTQTDGPATLARAEAEHLHLQVVARGQRLGREPDHDPVAQGRVLVGAGSDLVDVHVLGSFCLGRNETTGAQDRSDVLFLGAHWSSPSFSTTRAA